MIDNMNRSMQEAMRLMQTGDLRAATQAIQCAIRGVAEPALDTTVARGTRARDACLEGQFRVIPDGHGDTVQTPGTADLLNDDRHKVPEGEFRDHQFVGDAGALHYKLFTPAGGDAAALPLLVMLHGCTQTPDDFARGTRMNALAQEHRYVVAYPAQAQSNNPGKCWNWFRKRDQQRDQGEPALIAALTRHLVVTRGLDERRVYVAGLSAGGAMAAVLGSTYPDIYTAIGVHSGLPFGAAHDLPSALAAMRQGPGLSSANDSIRLNPVPAIVFHGDRDTTVDPCNGAAVVAQCMGENAADADAGRTSTHANVEHGLAPGGRAYTRTRFINPEGGVAAEHWVVHGAGHAWFGGDASGSYTDPSGPDASQLMLRFFSACARKVIN